MFLRVLRGGKKKTDWELIARYRKSGDTAVAGELYGRYMEWVFAICFKYLKDEERSKDAVMELFEKVSEGLRKHEVKHFKGWLHRVARNHCLMQLRSAQNRFDDGMQLFEDGVYLMENTMDPHLNNEADTLESDLSLMEQGLEKLPDGQRDCLRLFYLEKKCYKEIAETTGWELKQVKSHIQNGKRNLKIYMEKEREDVTE